MVSLRKRKENLNYAVDHEDHHEVTADENEAPKAHVPKRRRAEEVPLEDPSSDEEFKISDKDVEESDEEDVRQPTVPEKIQDLRRMPVIHHQQILHQEIHQPQFTAHSAQGSAEWDWVVKLVNHALLCLLEKDETGDIRLSKRKSHISSGLAKGDGIWLLHMKEVEDGRRKCPLPTCPKTFKTLPSIKYHLQTFRHSIPDFLNWAFYGEGQIVCRTGLGPEDLPETLTEFLERAPDDLGFDPMFSDAIYYVWPGSDTAQESSIMFDARSFTRPALASNGTIQAYATGHVGTQELTLEEQYVKRLMNLAVQCLLVKRPRLPLSNRCAGASCLYADTEKVITFQEGENEKFKCPIPTCAKHFKVQLSFKYHLGHFNHDLVSFLKWAYFGEGREQLVAFLQEQNLMVELPMTEHDLGRLLNDPGLFAGHNSIQADTVLYHWPGLDYAYDCTFLFEIAKEGQIRPRRTYQANPQVATMTQKEVSNLPTVCPPLLPNIDLGLPTVTVLPMLFPAIDMVEMLTKDMSTEYLPQEKNWAVQHATKKKTLDKYDFPPLACRALPEETGRKGFILNAGGAVFATEWCPNTPFDQPSYVAVGGALDASLDFIVGSRTPTSKGCIQLWEVPVECLDVTKEPLTQPRLDVVLCHDFGTVFDLRWCPVGCYQKVGESDFPRLGVFAATFHDGSLRVFSVPHATALRSVFGCQDDLKNPLFVRLRPVFSSVLKEGTYTRVSWKVEGDRVLLATGTATGEAVVFDLSQLPDSTGLENIYPPIFFRKEHQFFLRSIAWAERSEQGGRFVTSGYDGKLMISNLDDYQESDVLRRHNGFLTDVLWRADLEGIFFACSDNTVRYIPDYDRTKNPISIVHRSGIWSLDASKHHTFIASASADGSVQIANVMRQRARDIKNIQVPVYRVLYNYEDPSALTFCENEPAQEAMFQKADMRFWPLECIIYAARFHPEAYASTWIVSGGRTGVVRIESTYRDKAEQIGR